MIPSSNGQFLQNHHMADLPDNELINDTEPLSIDEIIDRALGFCANLPFSCELYVNQIRDLKSRLAKGRLQLAVLGQFNRGKSTFLNAITGINVLPTSVLPSTSVPTIISYANELSCKVRFLDSKPDLIVQQSLNSIRDALKKYVAEENNPNNQLCVKDVEVTCPSLLLENGTVLLDTPGFGSTHIHNTQTALTVLTECDAAIFLLSADPPLTQTELEFLKQVNLYVPRIFFVVNKTDLLTESELKTIDQFITNVLVMQMKYPADLKLFHICARKGEAAKGDFNSSEWKASGINAIKTEVLDFMIREKYFTLSEALNEKFIEALNGIEQKIGEEISDYNDPLNHLESEYSVIHEQCLQLKRTTEKEVKLIDIEESAVNKYLNEQVAAASASIKNELLTEFSGILNRATGKNAPAQSLSFAFSNLAIEKLRKFYLLSIYNCNKPIRKAVQIHLREFNSLIDNVKKMLGEKSFDSHYSIDKIDQCEIEGHPWNPSDTADVQFSTMWTDRFINREKQHDRFRRQFELSLNTLIPQHLESISQLLKMQIHDTFLKVHTLLEKDYGSLIKLLDESLKKKDAAMQERITAHGNRSADLQKKLDLFKSVRKMIH